MRSRHTAKDCTWDEIVLMLSVELQADMEYYAKSTGALEDPATRETVTDAEIVAQATAALYARLLDDEANALAIAHLQAMGKEQVETIWEAIE